MTALDGVNLALLLEWLYPVFDRLLLIAGMHPQPALRVRSLETAVRLLLLYVLWRLDQYVSAGTNCESLAGRSESVRV